MVWRSTDRHEVLSVDATAYQTDLAGTTFLKVDTAAAGEIVTLYNVTTGATIGTVNASTKGATRLAADGSYFWVAGSDKIEGWSLSGVKLFTKAGDYLTAAGNAPFYGAPDGVRIANGPAGANVIETISTSTGQATQSAAFLGTLSSWSLDGQNFVTSQSTGITRYYSKDVGAPLATLANVSIKGTLGNYYWSVSGSPSTPTIYSLAGVPATTVEGDIGTPTHSIAFGVGSTTVTVISLDSGPPFVKKSVTLPIPGFAKISSIVASQNGEWVATDDDGVIYDSYNKAADFGCGQLSSVACSANGTVALATTRGGIFLANATADHGTLFRRIPLVSTHVELSTNGDTLAADGPDKSVHIYSLPNGAGQTVSTGASPASFALVRGGSWLALPGEVTDLNGVVQYSIPPSSTHPMVSLPLFVSPDGSLAAYPDGSYTQTIGPGTVNTDIYKNGSLVNAVPGDTVGWLDDGHLMTLVKKPLASTISDASGTVLSSNALIPWVTSDASMPGYPQVGWRVLSASEIWEPNGNQVVDVNTGQVLVPPPTPPEKLPRGIGPNYIIGYDGGRVYTRAR